MSRTCSIKINEVQHCHSTVHSDLALVVMSIATCCSWVQGLDFVLGMLWAFREFGACWASNVNSAGQYDG